MTKIVTVYTFVKITPDCDFEFFVLGGLSLG